MQEQVLKITNVISGYIWDWPLLILLIGTGFYLTFLLRGIQFTHIIHAIKLIFHPSNKQEKGDISHFQALMTALSATVGTGNIAGVATAIATGGPGALFWMWVTGLLGMATKFSEAVLGVYYRETNSEGEMSGGPMYYMSNGLNMKWLAVIFSILLVMAAIGIGSMVQSNSMALLINDTFKIPTWVTGSILTVLATCLVPKSHGICYTNLKEIKLCHIYRTQAPRLRLKSEKKFTNLKRASLN